MSPLEPIPSADAPLLVEPADTLPSPEPPTVLPAEPPLPPGPHFGWACLWALLFMFISQIVIGIPLALVVFVLAGLELQPDGVFDDRQAMARFLTQAMELESSKTLLILGGQLGNVTIACCFALIAYRRRIRQKLAIRGVHPLHLLLVLLLTIPLYLVLATVAVLVKPYLPNLGLLDSTGKMISSVPWPVLVVGFTLCPGIGEEIFCRGFLGRGLVARHGLWLGVPAAAFLFGAIHIEPTQAAYAMVMGIGLQLVYLSTKSLTAAMLLHAGNNGLALLMSAWLSKLEFVKRLDGDGADTLLPWPLAAAAAAAVIGLLVLFWTSRIRWVQSTGEDWSPGYTTAEMPPPALDARPQLTRPPLWAVGLAIATCVAFVGAFVWRALA
jgi:CAAX protease family protein